MDEWVLDERSPDSRHDIWQNVAAHGIGVLLTVAMSGLFLLIDPVFPLSRFPLFYVLAGVTILYCYGIGPAVTTYVAGFLQFVFLFLSEGSRFWHPANSAEGWAAVAAFWIGSVLLSLPVVALRNSGIRIRQLVSELDRKETLLNTLVQNVPVGLAVIDAEMRYRLANESLARINNKPVRDTIGKTVYEVLNPELSGDTVVAVQQAMSTGEPVVWHDFRGPGVERYFDIEFVPVRIHSEEPIGVGVVVVETTEQVKSRQELELQRALLEIFMQNVPVGLAFLDRDLRYITANRALANINHVPVEETIGATVGEVLPGDLGKEVSAALRTVIDDGRSVSWYEIPSPHAGDDRVINAHYVPVWGGDGEIIGAGAILIDITDDVRAREELKRSLDREHRIAETLQTALLGVIPEKVDGLSVETLYRAALDEARVGGDFYDVFRIDNDRVAIVIGDVSGKGLAAAAQVATAKYSLRSRAYEAESVTALMEQVNRVMLQSADGDGFVTIFFGIWDEPNRTLTYVNGGHAPALLWKHTEDAPVVLKATGPMVGVFSTAKYQAQAVQLSVGDELFLGTDGLFEIWCDGRLLDVDDLANLYKETKGAGSDSVQDLVNSVGNICNNQFRDDIAILKVTVAE